MTRTQDYWTDLGAFPPPVLSRARVELHHGARILVEATAALSGLAQGQEPVGLAYLPDAGALVTPVLDASRPFRLGLSICSLEFQVLDRDGGQVARFPLGGENLITVAEWLRSVTTSQGCDPTAVALPRELGLAPHPLTRGGAFSDGLDEAVGELGRYFLDSQLVFEKIAEESSGAGSIEVLPESLVMAMRIEVAGGSEEHDPRLDVGFCPGDASYDEPYWFVSPWPPPGPDEVPVVSEPGHWHKEGWAGVVLTASELFARTDEQSRVLMRFLARAVFLARGLIFSG